MSVEVGRQSHKYNNGDNGARSWYPGLKPVSMKSCVSASCTLRRCWAGTPYVSQLMLRMHNTCVCKVQSCDDAQSTPLAAIGGSFCSATEASRHCSWEVGELLLGLQMRQKHHCREEPRHKAANMGQVRGPRGCGGHRDDEVDQECNHHDAPQDGPAGGTLTESARLQARKKHTPMYQGQDQAWHPGLCTKEHYASCACCSPAGMRAKRNWMHARGHRTPRTQMGPLRPQHASPANASNLEAPLWPTCGCWQS